MEGWVLRILENMALSNSQLSVSLYSENASQILKPTCKDEWILPISCKEAV